MKQYVEGLVSVIIPTYKRSLLLKKSIVSVLNQTYKKIELIVVNDNEKNDEYSQELYKLIASIDDERLHFIEQDSHVNGAVARNVGIANATGEYISFLDDDDYWELEKIERQLKLLSSLNEEWGAVSCLMRLYKNNILKMATIPYKSGNILIDLLERKTSLGTGALLIRRRALDDVGYFDENLIRHQDLQLFSRLAYKYKIQLDKVYLHNREISDSQNRPTIDRLEKVKKDYFNSISDIMDNLSRREKKIVFIMHDFECAYAFFKAGKRIEAIKKALKIFITPETIWLALYGGYKRFVTHKCLGILEKKYQC